MGIVLAVRTLQLDFPRLWHINLKGSIGQRCIGRKTVLVPEFSRSQRLDARHYVIFERDAGLEIYDRNMFLPEVAVHWGFAEYVGREILGGRDRSISDLAIGPAHTDVVNTQIFVRRGVSEHELPECLHPGLALNANDRSGLAQPTAIVLKTHRLVPAFEDKGFLRKIRRSISLRLGPKRRREQYQGEKRKNSFKHGEYCKCVIKKAAGMTPVPT